MMNTGERAISVDAIPALVYLTAISDIETPSAGPKTVMMAVYFIPLPSLSEAARVGRSFCSAIMARKPKPPITALNIVDAKGSMVLTMAGASAGTAST